MLDHEKSRSIALVFVTLSLSTLISNVSAYTVIALSDPSGKRPHFQARLRAFPS
jgi:hypothetical protein